MTDNDPRSLARQPRTWDLPSSHFVAAIVLTSFRVQWKTRAMVAHARRDVPTIVTAVEA
jgi:hypothetical protein